MKLNATFCMMATAGGILPATLSAQSVLAKPILADKMPNVVVIVADDLGYGDLSCYGATQLKTHGMDRLANEGLLFTDSHATAATSTPAVIPY